MFERYTEKARRAIFYSRYEASEYGSPYIETEHLLLGLLREDKALTYRFVLPASVEHLRQQIDAHSIRREKTSVSVDLPLSNECKRALHYATEEAEALSHQHIGTEHLLLGLLREEESFAAQLLRTAGLDLAAVRRELSTHAGGEVDSTASERGAQPENEPQGGGHAEFIDDVTGQRVAIVGIGALPFVPRVGELIVLPDPAAGEATWRVLEVTCDFRACFPSGQYRNREFASVRLRVSRQRPSGGRTAPLEST